MSRAHATRLTGSYIPPVRYNAPCAPGGVCARPTVRVEAKRVVPARVAPGGELEAFGETRPPPRPAPAPARIAPAAVAAPLAAVATDLADRVADAEASLASLRADLTNLRTEQEARLAEVEAKLAPPGTPFTVAEFLTNNGQIVGFRSSQGRDYALSSPLPLGGGGVTINQAGQAVVPPRVAGETAAVLPVRRASPAVVQAQTQHNPSVRVVPAAAVVPAAPAFEAPPFEAPPAAPAVSVGRVGSLGSQLRERQTLLRPAAAGAPPASRAAVPPTAQVGLQGLLASGLARQRAGVAPASPPRTTPATTASFEEG